MKYKNGLMEEKNKMVRGYSSSIKIDENTGASLSYFDDNEIMNLTIGNYQKRKSLSFYRQGNDEESMRLNLFQISGLANLIKENIEKIKNDLRGKPLWKSQGFRNLWGLKK